MAPREEEEEKQSRRGTATPKPEAEENSSSEAADQTADEETVAADVDADCPFKDEPDDDEAIRIFNKIGRTKVCTPEFVEDLKREHRIFLALCKNHYDEMIKDRQEEERIAAAAAAAQASSQDNTNNL